MFQILAYNLCSKLAYVDQAIRDSLEKVGKDKYISPHADFNKMICSLVRKYLSLYQDDEVKYDIVMDAFAYVFGKNLKKAFANFDSEYKGRKIPIENYINTLLSRAIINASKKHLRELENKKSIRPIDDEGYNDAFDRVLHNSKVVKRIIPKCAVEDEVKHLRSINKDYKKEYMKVFNDNALYLKNEKEWKKRLENLERKIKNTIQEIRELNGELKECVINEVPHAAELEITPEEERDFEILKKRLIDHLSGYKKDYQQSVIKVLEMLIAGFSQREIADVLEVSPMSVSRYVKVLKKEIQNMAKDLDEKHRNSDLKYYLSLFASISDGKVSTVGRRETMTEGELFRQVFRIFGDAFIEA